MSEDNHSLSYELDSNVWLQMKEQLTNLKKKFAPDLQFTENDNDQKNLATIFTDNSYHTEAFSYLNLYQSFECKSTLLMERKSKEMYCFISAEPITGYENAGLIIKIAKVTQHNKDFLSQFAKDEKDLPKEKIISSLNSNIKLPLTFNTLLVVKQLRFVILLSYGELDVRYPHTENESFETIFVKKQDIEKSWKDLQTKYDEKESREKETQIITILRKEKETREEREHEEHQTNQTTDNILQPLLQELTNRLQSVESQVRSIPPPPILGATQSAPPAPSAPSAPSQELTNLQKMMEKVLQTNESLQQTVMESQSAGDLVIV